MKDGTLDRSIPKPEVDRLHEDTSETSKMELDASCNLLVKQIEAQKKDESLRAPSTIPQSFGPPRPATVPQSLGPRKPEVDEACEEGDSVLDDR